MKCYQFTIQVESAFGTPLVGDTLFGQLCWAIVHQYGKERLDILLEGYLEQKPFMVVSDAFPKGYLPLPVIPSRYWEKGEEQDRKTLKKRQWIALTEAMQAVRTWQKSAKSDKEIDRQCTEMQAQNISFKQVIIRTHNTINRQTQTTGNGQFSPYSTTEIWYRPQTELDLYIVIDETKIEVEELKCCLENIGKFGFGRDASIGLGKFSLSKVSEFSPPSADPCNAYLTLANCAPHNMGFDPERSYYQITTRFGRHGDIQALYQNPFKKPILLAKTAAVFTPLQWQTRQFIGNGLGDISYSQPKAVHQGYAPVIPIYLDFE